MWFALQGAEASAASGGADVKKLLEKIHAKVRSTLRRGLPLEERTGIPSIYIT